MAAVPGEHEEFLNGLFESKPQWSKYRTWSDETTIASHESLTVRAEFDHEARHRTDIAWTIAENDGPVGERLWRATITAGTPVPFIRAIIGHLDDPHSTEATEPHGPLHGAGWAAASHPARTTWRAPDRSLTFEHQPRAVDDPWAAPGGDDGNRPTWSIRLSAGTPRDLLTQLTSIAADAASLPQQPRGAQLSFLSFRCLFPNRMPVSADSRSRPGFASATLGRWPGLGCQPCSLRFLIGVTRLRIARSGKGMCAWRRGPPRSHRAAPARSSSTA
ncbi:DUF317 domain-containing protein [Streptomyces virginiae]|uniref:DUF317 domain-containing protein n=1 Tax=Streptomyces virginiae TaxID=1961 RepID=UPI0036B00BD0